MPWFPTPPWIGMDATELRPVIVAICNAVGDRWEAIGDNRPSWPVNTAQSIFTVTVGTKSATLIEDDLFGLDLFRYNWWGLVALSIAELLSTPTTWCRGFCTSSSADGKSASRWTLSSIESAVGLGSAGSSAIGGGTMHLFDEVAPARFKAMLDLMIYPAIYLPAPTGSGHDSSRFESPLADHVEGIDNAGDAWRAMVADGTGLTSSGIGASVGWFNAGPGPLKWIAVLRDLTKYTYDLSATPNGVGVLGTVLSQFYNVKWVADHLITGTADINGDSVVMSGTTPFGGTDVELTGLTHFNLTGSTDVVFSWASLDMSNSPFDGVDTPTIYTMEDVGDVSVVPNNPTGDDANRIVVDISAHCSDQ